MNDDSQCDSDDPVEPEPVPDDVFVVLGRGLKAEEVERITRSFLHKELFDVRG